MTSEERAARRKLKKLSFPYAELRERGPNSHSVLLKLQEGDDHWLEVWERGGREGVDSGWRSTHISLANIEDLGKFIHALICRYNAMVDRANASAEKPRMKRLTATASEVK